MPPRFTYWTIIFGGQPTAFRSGSRDELLPTFKQIQTRHPDAQLRFFARGKLWYSEEEAQAALVRERFDKSRRPRAGSWPSGPGSRKPDAAGPPPEPGSRERRGRDWRPGGAHKDPRDRFKVPRDVKRARFKARLGFTKPDSGSAKPGTPDRKPQAGSRKPPTGGWKRPPGPHGPPRRRGREGGFRKKKDDE